MNISYQAGGRHDFPFWPTKHKPYIKGFRLVSRNPKDEVVYAVKEEMEFFSVVYAADEYDGEDNWSVDVNGKTVIETVYSKSLPEAINFSAIIPLRAGDKITFTFHNDSNKPKEVYFNFLFGRD